jgi:hypothetical protein
MRIDHIAIWTRKWRALCADLARLTGRPVLEGWRPDGALKAEGLRFANGAFLDIHEPPPGAPDTEVGHVLLGLGAGVDDAERLGAAHGWRRATDRRSDGPDAPPWSLVSFRRGQGVLSAMFVIEYAADPAAFLVPEYAGALYRPAPVTPDGAQLRRVWLSSPDMEADTASLTALGFTKGGELRSAFAPFDGVLYRCGASDLLLCAGPEAGVARIDLDLGDPTAAAVQLPLSETFSLVCGERI